MASLQDDFFNDLKINKIPVEIFLTTKFKIDKAIIVSFDNFVLLLELYDDNGTLIGQQLIFKHAISSVLPKTDYRYGAFPKFQKDTHSPQEKPPSVSIPAKKAEPAKNNEHTHSVLMESVLTKDSQDMPDNLSSKEERKPSLAFVQTPIHSPKKKTGLTHVFGK